MARQTLTFDASGRNGHNGQDGWNGHDGGRGQDGGQGGDASSPSPGQHGGLCELVLRSGATDPSLGAHQLLIEGYVQAAGAGQSQVKEQLSPGQLGKLVVRAQGGRGGAGGVGGDGGDGGTGHSGSDATRYSSGGDGGRGGDGGDGGRGTSGANGGDGGRCLLRMAQGDTWILMALEGAVQPEDLVQGGRGGPSGHHGQGGSGGSGGPGGDSYSWTETRTRSVTKIDAEGRAYQDTETYHEHFRNSGGSRGPSGSRGWTPNTALRTGRHGAPGQFVFEVHSPQGAQRWPGRYNLELVDFTLSEDQPEDSDGILEFGEVVRASHFLVRNTGRMPTPPQQRIRLILQQGQWLHPLGDELFLEQSLAPGEHTVLEGHLRLRVSEADIQEPGDPFVVQEEVHPRALQLGPESADRPAQATAFQRAYEDFVFTQTLTAQYPVENREGITALRSLAAGEKTWILFDVANVSEKALGAEAARARPVGVQIEFLGGDVPLEDLVFEDSEGRALDLGRRSGGFEGLFVPLPRIEAHQSVHVRGRVGFKEHVAPYSGATLRYTLWLEDREEAGRWRLAQRREITLRAEPAYRWRPESRVTLVTHNNTTQHAFLAWKRLLEEELGLPFDHWSIARYGHFDHQKELADGTRLREHMEDRVALVLNQPFQARHSDQTDLPSDYIKGEDFRRGATSNNTHFLLVGSGQFGLRQWLEPTSELRTGGDDFPDKDRFLQKEARTGGPLTTEIFKEDITTDFDEVALHSWSFPFMTPDASKELDKEAHKLQQTLVRMHPNRRYVLIKDEIDAPERAGRRWLLFPRWRVGSVEVRRSLNTETSSAVSLLAQGESMGDPTFIFSPEVRYAVLLALPFEEKLGRLNWILQQPSRENRLATGRALVQALLTDLAEEQSALMEGGGRLNEEILKEKLSNLGRLAQMPLHTQLSVDSAKWELLLELCAGLSVMAEAAAPWWKLWGRQRSMESYLSQALDRILSDLFDRYAVDPDGQVAMDSKRAREHIKKRSQELSTQIQARRQHLSASLGRKVSEAFAARDQFEHPSDHQGQIVRDIDAWLDPKQRVWSRQDFERAMAGEAQRAQKQADQQARNQQVRQALLAQGNQEQDEGAAARPLRDLQPAPAEEVEEEEITQEAAATVEA